jgi:RecA-family ATPase
MNQDAIDELRAFADAEVLRQQRENEALKQRNGKGHYWCSRVPPSGMHGDFKIIRGARRSDDEAEPKGDGRANPERDAQQSSAETLAPFIIISPADLDGVIPEPRPWLSEGISLRRNVTLMSAHGGTGKSQLCLQAQASAGVSKLWVGQPLMRCRLLGIYCEDEPSELHHRTLATAENLGVRMKDLEAMRYVSRVGDDTFLAGLDTRTGILKATDMLNLLHDSAAAMQAQLIILDTASDMYDADENVRRHVRRFIRMLRRLAIKLDAAVWLTGMSRDPGQATTAAKAAAPTGTTTSATGFI